MVRLLPDLCKISSKNHPGCIFVGFLIWVNGEYDPWRSATVSWEGRPGGALKSTKNAPVWLLKGAAHCNDYRADNAAANAGTKKMFDGAASQMQAWVADIYKSKGIQRP